jgi:hypothetical protein
MTTELFRKKSDLQRNLMVGGAIGVAGAVVTFVYGAAGAVLLGGAVIVLVGAFMRSKQALVTMESKGVMLRFTEPVNVPFKSIARTENKNQDLELCLHTGAKVVVQLALLEEADGAWLRKQLRKEIRAANA